MKPDLYDILVELPHRDTNHSKAQRNTKQDALWPTIKRSDTGAETKATQRDLRRYRLLRHALSPLSRMQRAQHPQRKSQDNGIDSADEDERTHLLYRPTTTNAEEDNESNSGSEKLAEPFSWSALAYSSFMWWASAGEREDGREEEEEQDHHLLSDLGEVVREVADSQWYHD